MNMLGLLAAIVIVPFQAPHVDFANLPLEQQLAFIEVIRPDPPGRVVEVAPLPALPAPVGEPWFQPLIERHFRVEDYEWAARVSLCESGWRADAKNPSGAAGLFQMMPGWYTGEWGYRPFDPFDPEQNVEAAAWLLSVEGKSQWVCK